MMHRIWAKIAIAGMILMGDGAFAYESNECGDDGYKSVSNAVQLSQPAVVDDNGPGWQPYLAHANKMQPDINPDYQIFAVAIVPVPDPQKYLPFSPRAPPVPAS